MVPVVWVRSIRSGGTDRSVGGVHSRKPTVAASLWNMRIVVCEKTSRSLPKDASFFKQGGRVTVMMCTPMSSACRTLRISRGLAHSSAKLGIWRHHR